MSGSQPLVSVIIPVYNAEKHLRTAVDSVLAQTFQDWELILVDDGSTDASGVICDAYAREDGRVRVIHRKNGGCPAAWNTGLDASQAPWVFFLDNDDWIELDALERLMACAEGMDVVMGDYPEKVAPWRSVHEVRRFCLAQAGLEEMSELFFLRFFHPVWNKLYRRSALTSRFREDVTYIDDVTFNLAQVPGWHSVCVIPEVTYHHIQRSGSMTYSFRIDRMEQVRESIRLFRGMFPDGSLVMETLSRWYVIELRLYLRYYSGQQSVPEEVRRLMLQLWLEDDGFDHGRISTALLNRELLEFWEAVLRRDVDALMDMLANL